MRSSPFTLAGLLLLSASACTGAQSGPGAHPEAPPVASALAKPAAAPPTARADVAAADAGDPEDAKAWTDPAVAERLAADCRWRPTRGADKPYRESPLACGLDFEQSCVADPCFDDDQERCKPACVKTCQACGDGCASTCESCKAGCADDACRRACAARCGECHAACLREEDRCKTGTCGQAFAACHARLGAEWRRGGCTAECERVYDCAAACEDKNPLGPCATACATKHMRRCPKRFATWCVAGAAPNGLSEVTPATTLREGTGACKIDADCVPADCCHARTCTAKARAPKCGQVGCSQDVVPGTLDMGQCVCRQGRCAAEIRDQ